MRHPDARLHGRTYATGTVYATVLTVVYMVSANEALLLLLGGWMGGSGRRSMGGPESNRKIILSNLQHSVSRLAIGGSKGGAGAPS